MKKPLIRNVREVWDSGHESLPEMSFEETINFKRATGSGGVVGLRWEFEGKAHSVDSYGYVLPDRSGVALVGSSPGHERTWLEVVNADGSLRFRMWPPDIAPILEHETAKIEGARPGWPGSGIEFGVQAAYRTRPEKGKTQYGLGILLDIDWTNGAYKGFEVIQR